MTQLHITRSVVHPRAYEALSAGFLFCMNRDLAWPPFGLPFLLGPLHKCPQNHSRAHTPSAELTAHPDPRVRWADGHLHVPSPGSTAHALLCPQWSEDVCAAHLTQRDGYQATTQGQLKEQLYQEIIHYFDKGKVKKKKKAIVLSFSFFCTPSQCRKHVLQHTMFVEPGICYKLCIGRFCACAFHWDF